MSETAAMRNVFIDPADLLIVILYSLVKGINAFINPPIISIEETDAIIINDHLRKRKILSILIIPGILSNSKIISDRRKNKKPYSMNASQKPPRIFRISVITEECFDSRIFATIKITASKKKVNE